MKKVRLGEVCTVVSGSTPKTTVAEFWDGNFNWITPAEINEDTVIINESKRKITKKGVLATGLSSFPAGTVLLSSRAPIGKTAITGTEMYCNQGFKNLICNDTIYNKYLFWFLRSKTEYLNSLGRGATFKEISKSIVENIEIPLPSFEEQKKIASILDKFSDLITLRKQQLAKLDELVKSRFVEMFGDSQNIGKRWNLQTFKELTELITDGEHATPRRTEQGIYLLSARNILNHSLQLDDVDYIDQDEYNRISKRIAPREGDVLISCSGTVGRCCSVPAGIRFQLVRSVALLRFKTCINPVFAEHMITSEFLQEQINSSKTASSQANLFQGKIAKLRGISPPKELQELFERFVQQTNKSKVDIKKSLEELNLLKKSLMQEYFG